MATPKRSPSRSVVDAQVHLALPPQHHFVRLRIVHDGDRGIFLGELVQRLAEFDVVLALLRRDRDRQHRRIGLDLGQGRMGLLAGGQRLAGLRLVELGEGDGFADLGRPALLAALADELENAGDAAGLVVAGHEGRAVAGLPGKHPHDRHLAAVRGVLRLEHIGDGVASGAFTPSRLAVSAMPGDSWRSAFSSRNTPLARVAVPISTGQTSPSRNSRVRSSNTLSRGGWMSSSNCSISSSS